MKKFQFHKVRLKANYAEVSKLGHLFQFHKVRLKEYAKFKGDDLEFCFNSIRYD